MAGEFSATKPRLGAARAGVIPPTYFCYEHFLAPFVLEAYELALLRIVH